MRYSADHIELCMQYGIDIPNRTLYCTSYASPSNDEGGVDYLLCDRLLKGLGILDTMSDTPINLIINNFGGEDDHCRAIMGAIRNCRSEVIGTVYGRAESAAAWILQACDVRKMDRLSSLMVHMGSGTKDRHARHIDDVFTQILLERMRQKDSGYSKAKLVNRLHDDWFVYPTQALALGLCDEVIGE